MSVGNHARRGERAARSARDRETVAADDVDALFAMDHLPIYSQRYRKARDAAADETRDDGRTSDGVTEKRRPQAVDLPRDEASAARKKAGSTSVHVDAASVSNERRPLDDQGPHADPGKAPKRDIRDARLGRITRKVPAGTPARAVPDRRPVRDDIMDSVKRRSLPQSEMAAHAPGQASRRWLGQAAAASISFLLAVISWPADLPVDEVGSGQGGPVVVPEETVDMAAIVTETLPQPGDPQDVEGWPTSASDPPTTIEPAAPSHNVETDDVVDAPSVQTTTPIDDAGAASDMALADILAVTTAREARGRSEVSPIATMVEEEVQRLARSETDVAAAGSPAPEARLDSRIVIHLRAGDPLDSADSVIRALVDAGYDQPELRRVDFEISATNVRYFFSDDRADAERIDRIVTSALQGEPRTGPRDFTHYRPLPIEDTIEVWLND